MISAVILAAGTSSRMGENKLFLPFPKDSILQTVIKTVKSAGIENIIVVLGHEAQKVKNHIKELNVRTVINHNYEKGMCTTFQTGVKVILDENPDGVLLCLGDQPLINRESIKSLINVFYNKRDETKVFVLSHKGKKGHPVLFDKSTISEILAIPEDKTIREVVHKYETKETKIETDDGVLKDIDTKEDYQLLKPNN